MTTTDTSPSLICFSHLRWNFVFQRPQHLMTRYPGDVFYIEEAIFTDAVDWLSIQRDSNDNIRVVTPHLNQAETTSVDDRMAALIDSLIDAEGISSYILWYYSPMALKFSRHLDPVLSVYDCMDELSAFKFAPPELLGLEKELFSKVDLVFTGGKSLFAAKKHFHENMYVFPSSIDKDHFAKARQPQPEPIDQQSISHPRLGFYGVIDERLDVQLIDELASICTDWNIIMIGPVVKIDPAALPARPNIYYLGPKKYEQLPQYLAGWDIAIMPFAINESTTFISPTKTPEYLSGGKPVISTPIADVVNDYGKWGLVNICSDAKEFIVAAERILAGGKNENWLRKVDTRLSSSSWDATWEQMYALMSSLLNRKLHLSDQVIKNNQN